MQTCFYLSKYHQNLQLIFFQKSIQTQALESLLAYIKMCAVTILPHYISAVFGLYLGVLKVFFFFSLCLEMTSIFCAQQFSAIDKDIMGFLLFIKW